MDPAFIFVDKIKVCFKVSEAGKAAPFVILNKARIRCTSAGLVKGLYSQREHRQPQIYQPEQRIPNVLHLYTSEKSIFAQEAPVSKKNRTNG
jgi:hypothetical protein